MSEGTACLGFYKLRITISNERVASIRGPGAGDIRKSCGLGFI
jgi:hypothetical protein